MPKDPENRRLLDEQDLIRWREGTMNAEHDAAEDASDASSASQPLTMAHKSVTNFHKAAIHQQTERKQSLLTKALQPQPNQAENSKPQLYMTTEMSRQRSSRSTTSTASTADLTSDGFTSPTRASTPSPTFPSQSYLSFAPYTLGPKLAKAAYPIIDGQLPPAEKPAETVSKPDPALEAIVKKRTISFAIGGKPKEPVSTKAQSSATEEEKPVEAPTPKRTIKFAAAVPKPDRQAVTLPKTEEPVKKATLAPPPRERSTSRSPSMSRKVRVATQDKKHRDSTGTVRRASQSPAAFRRKPKFIAADNEALKSTEARFHEFASDEPQEDDWIRNDDSHTKAKLTIDDTLKKENAIRRLAEEAEDEEALEDDDDEDDENEDENDDDDDDDDEDDDDDMDEEDEVSDEDGGITAVEEDDDDVTIGSDIDLDASDGNETDNEFGFAESDDDDDPNGEYAFWTPGKYLFASSGEANTFRPSVMRKNRRMSDSSIDSLDHMSPVGGKKGEKTGRMKPSRKIKIRPGTPDLPDSTDFVCGTLDEDRPLEEAYKSCMEARHREKRHLIPQDIDPSFPTSDPEAEEDEVDDVEGAEESDGEPLWLHGKFEDSDTSSRRHRRSRKSPKHSPRRLHSPPPKARHRSPAPAALRHRSPPPLKHRSPPPATRHRSPPPRRLFGQSPRGNRVLPANVIHSPPASLTNPSNIAAIFEPLGNRPGLTHTKSLPRRPNNIMHQYRRSQLEAAIAEEDDDNDGHTRGAIDIVKGLEQKRERRKEKFYKKLCDKARKGQHVQRRPQPGRGAERMKELGLQMAGKTIAGQKTGKAEYVLSV